VKKLAVLLSLFLLSICSLAQTSQGAAKDADATGMVPKEQQATKEDVTALMQALHSRQQSEAMLTAMSTQFNRSIHDNFLQEHPNASPAVLKKLDETMDPVWKMINVDELLTAAVPIYQKYLSHDDVIALISFYSSPAGQHFLDRMPMLMKEASEMGGNIMRGRMADIQKAAADKMAEFDKYLKAHPEELGAPAQAKTDQ